MSKVHQEPASQSKSLDFKRFLPILDIKINIDGNSNVTYKLHKKPANKGLILHYESHHPRSVKRAVARNELRRAIRCSTADYREEAVQAATTRLLQNGYPPSYANIKAPTGKKANAKTKAKPLFCFNLPFVSDALNNKIRHMLKKHDIPARLVNKWGRTIERFLSTGKDERRSKCTGRKECPAPDICHQSSVVYRASCGLCYATYIGATVRRLHDRVREHMRAAEKGDKASALGEHYNSQHPRERRKISFEIVDRCRDKLRLRIKEAFSFGDTEASTDHQPT